ncbi:copper amine oxidase N-terminal domain-containing protein [Paenibacillus whitsoniae]|uniref:Copper amine oxidase N-terminal domain-containing protein n=1 Tax=Paenibacillus whitsoniae TaxID=2496558 RepID=A0A430JC68_9BACL|nr:copper amine oxidase N-terminal domain-containing protein [Paenibacillus whitsoniae]RTE08642.1 copper amine oxidase N-terminal domain-containing protein [Paenibacillus whitsoniae]
MKRLLKLFLSLIFVTLILTPTKSFASDVPISVFINGIQVIFTQEPVIEEGTTLVQLRPIFEGVGLEVGWDEGTKTITGTAKEKQIVLKIGDTNAEVNEKSTLLEKAARIINGDTFVPLRFIGESCDGEVTWDENKKRIDIVTDKVVTFSDFFKKYSWGTSIDKIKSDNSKLEMLVDFDYVVGYENYSLFDLPATVYYHFKEGKLWQIAYRITDKDSSYEYFTKLRQELGRAYGNPKSEGNAFTSEKAGKSISEQLKGKSKDEASKIIYNGITNGDMHLGAEWAKDDYTVNMMLSNSGTTKKKKTFIDISIRKNGIEFTGSK